MIVSDLLPDLDDSAARKWNTMANGTTRQEVVWSRAEGLHHEERGAKVRRDMALPGR